MLSVVTLCMSGVQFSQIFSMYHGLVNFTDVVFRT